MNAWVREWRAAREAVRFFTRVPLPSAPEFPREIRWAMTYFPLVGWLVGGIAAGVFWGAARLWPAAIASALSFGATVLLTGAFHEDGLADVCDGIGGGGNRDRVLAIMKDSRIGAFGGIGLGLVVLLKWQSVASAATFNVDGVRRVAAGLWCAHTLSRGVVCLVPTMLPYLDSAGSKSRPLLEPLSGFRMAAAGSFAVVPTLVCGKCGIFSAIRLGVGAAVMLAIALGLSGWFSKRLGGYTGDCLGAVQQLTELAFYLVVFATWR